MPFAKTLNQAELCGIQFVELVLRYWIEKCIDQDVSVLMERMDMKRHGGRDRDGNVTCIEYRGVASIVGLGDDIRFTFDVPETSLVELSRARWEPAWYAGMKPMCLTLKKGDHTYLAHSFGDITFIRESGAGWRINTMELPSHDEIAPLLKARLNWRMERSENPR